MRKIIAACVILMACGAAPVPEPAVDEDPRYCSHKYPLDEEPELCESTSYGDCCTWDIEEEGETCRYDYCSYYGTQDCEWKLQHRSCAG